MLLLQVGKRYIFVGQRYIYSGTVVTVTPTHAQLGEDAMVHYEDVGPFTEWVGGQRKNSSKQGGIPGWVVSMLGCDWGPIP